MVPDIIEVDQLQTGQRREGSYYAFASFFQKLATGIAIWAMGIALSYAGYITPGQGEAFPPQPETAVQAIRIFTSLVPVALLVGAILCAWFYPIGRAEHRQMREQLAQQEP
jgi:GPH family glycoside/pentoside/hexuronide:cation symporter